MKKTIFVLLSFLLLNYGKICCRELVAENIASPEDSIRVLSTPDLFKLSVMWAGEYSRLHPETKIEVKNVSDYKMADDLEAGGNIGFVSNEYYSGFKSESVWKVVVGRDIIVPIINSKNPFSDDIYKHGISSEVFGRFFIYPDSQKWGMLLKNKQTLPARYYWVNDESIKKSITTFLKISKIRIDGIEVENSEKMISAIQKDPYAIGFCKMINITDFKKQNIVENIRLLPIDRNGNGIIDYNEKIYDNFNLFSRGVWIGKYPKALFSNIYSVSSTQPTKVTEVAFIKWVLTDGQQFLASNGYSDLQAYERVTTVDKLYNAKIYSGATINEKYLLRTLLFIIASIILAGLIINTLVRYRKQKKASVKISDPVLHNVIDENSVLVPAGLYFDKTHIWAFREQDGMVKIGVDDFLQHITGTITRIKMPQIGEKVNKGDQILSIIQNGKQLNFYAPISGTIKELNKILDSNSSIINTSPYTEGWIYKIQPSNWFRESQLLFMADKYTQYMKNEFSRLKDFLAVALKTDTEKYTQIILQDGGVLRDGILSNLGPEVWEDFQTKFIDPSRQVWFYELF